MKLTYSKSETNPPSGSVLVEGLAVIPELGIEKIFPIRLSDRNCIEMLRFYRRTVARGTLFPPENLLTLDKLIEEAADWLNKGYCHEPDGGVTVALQGEKPKRGGTNGGGTKPKAARPTSKAGSKAKTKK